MAIAPSRYIGVIYSVSERIVRQIYIPTFDWELDDPKLLQGEPGLALMKLPRLTADGGYSLEGIYQLVANINKQLATE